MLINRAPDVHRKAVDVVSERVLRRLRDKTVHFIFGPPGTGSTATQLRLARRVETGGKVYKIGRKDCTVVYYNVSMKEDAYARTMITLAERYGGKVNLTRTLDGFIASALHGEYDLYVAKPGDKWLDSASAMKALRAKFAARYHMRYTADPFETDNKGHYAVNEAFRFLDYAVNALVPADLLKAIDFFTKPELKNIHPLAPHMLRSYVSNLLKKRRVDFTTRRWLEMKVRRKSLPWCAVGRK